MKWVLVAFCGCAVSILAAVVLFIVFVILPGIPQQEAAKKAWRDQAYQQGAADERAGIPIEAHSTSNGHLFGPTVWERLWLKGWEDARREGK